MGLGDFRQVTQDGRAYLKGIIDLANFIPPFKKRAPYYEPPRSVLDGIACQSHYPSRYLTRPYPPSSG